MKKALLICSAVAIFGNAWGADITKSRTEDRLKDIVTNTGEENCPIDAKKKECIRSECRTGITTIIKTHKDYFDKFLSNIQYNDESANSLYTTCVNPANKSIIYKDSTKLPATIQEVLGSLLQADEQKLTFLGKQCKKLLTVVHEQGENFSGALSKQLKMQINAMFETHIGQINQTKGELNSGLSSKAQLFNTSFYPKHIELVKIVQEINVLTTRQQKLPDEIQNLKEQIQKIETEYNEKKGSPEDLQKHIDKLEKCSALNTRIEKASNAGKALIESIDSCEQNLQTKN